MPKFIGKGDEQNVEYDGYDEFDELEGEDGEDSEATSEEYHDDPIVVEKRDHNRLVRGFGAFVILIVSASYYLSTSIGGRITLNSGANPIIFGQGSVATPACTEGESLEVSGFSTPSQDSSGFKLSSIVVKNVPETCNYKDLIISVYDDSSNTPLTLRTSNDPKIYIYKSVTETFQRGKYALGYSLDTISKSSFKITFDTPITSSENIKKVVVESADHQEWLCQDGGDCRIGDTGPGGGTIFYVKSEGFNCGSSFTSTGSPTGGQCNFLEIAPPSFLAPVYKPRIISNMNPVRVLTVPYEQIGGIANWSGQVSSSIGGGLRNTNYIISLNGNTNSNLSCTTISDCGYAHNITRLYTSNEFSDWYLPTVGEATQLCKWIYGQAYVSDTQACANSGTINSGYSVWTLNKGGGLILSEFQSSTVMTIMIANGNTCGGSPVVGTLTRWAQSNLGGNTCQNFFAIPIRAF